MKNNLKKEVIIYKRVRNSGASGLISFPKFLVGQEVKISFIRNLTEEEKKMIELNKLQQELAEIRSKRKKKYIKKDIS